jgi:hypothetical protein
VAATAGFVAGVEVTGFAGGFDEPRVCPWLEKLSDSGLPKQLPMMRRGLEMSARKNGGSEEARSWCSVEVSWNRAAPRDGLGGWFSADARRRAGGGLWGCRDQRELSKGRRTMNMYSIDIVLE